MPLTRLATATAVAAALALGVSVGPATAATSQTPPKLKDVSATANTLSRRFMDAVTVGANPGLLRAFLSPAFVIERSNETTDGWPAYLTTHPVFTGDYSLNVTRAQYSAPVMTVLAVTSGTQIVNGAPVTVAPGSNLATYAWTPRGWKITSYARFNAVN
jgi:hypothetical protein